MTCTFFGHRDSPASIRPLLYETILSLVETHGVTRFYVGDSGHFDAMAYHCLVEIAAKHPEIRYCVVLAYLPGTQKTEALYAPQETILPEGIERVPPRFAVSHRNRWMLRQSEFVVTYITRNHGGAAQFAKMAETQGKTILALGRKIQSSQTIP